MLRTKAGAAIACAATIAGLLAAAPQASASPLSVSVSCESGASRFICYSIIEGGTAPYSTTWTPIANASFTATGSDFVAGACTARGVVRVQATVTDAALASASGTGSVICSNGPWP